MNNKNYKQLAREVLSKKDFEPLNIQVSSHHMQRLEGVAQALDLTLSETATFLLYAYMNDVELFTRQQIDQAMPRN